MGLCSCSQASTRHIRIPVFVPLLLLLLSVVEGTIPFWDDISHEAHRHVVLDYDGDRPSPRTLSGHEKGRELWSIAEPFNEAEDAAKQDIVYSTRDSNFTPIRISFDTALLESRIGESAARDAMISDILDALPQAAAQWSRHLHTMPVRSAIAINPDMCFGIYGNALQGKRWLETDLVVVVSGQDELVDYDGVSTFSVCSESTLALASACELDQHDRPVLGFMNFCLDHDSTAAMNYLQQPFGYYLGVDFYDEHIQISNELVAVHELGHILAFSSWMYKYFRNPDGTPRTERPFREQTIPCSPDGVRTGVLPSADTMASAVDPVTGKRSYSIVTPRVQQVARNLLGCDTIDGARLAEGTECYGSHWHERLFLGELLSPVLSASSENILSPLTLALMEDSGWYRVDYRDVDTPAFGLGAGCQFATESCIQDDQVPNWGSDMFCSYPLTFNWNGGVSPASLNHVICDPSHRWWTVCDLWDTQTVPDGLEVEFPESSERYFSNENLVTSFANADSCPIPVRSLGYDCTQGNDQYTPFYPGEQVGPDSRCIVASRDVGNGLTSYRPACMATRCDGDLGKLVILLEDTEEHVCDQDGEMIQLVDGSELQCPRLASVCPQLATCPSACSGRGKCDYQTTPPRCGCDSEEYQNEGCFSEINPPTDSRTSADASDSSGADRDQANDPGNAVNSSSSMVQFFLVQVLPCISSAVSLYSQL